VLAWGTFRFEVVDDGLNFRSMDPAERGFGLVRDFQLKGKGFFLVWWIFREVWLKNGC
jgi:hypothetical protein